MKKYLPLITIFALLLLAGSILLLDRKKNEDRSYVSIVFDDGYTDMHDNVLPILNEYNISSTFYIIPGLVGEKFEEEKIMDWEQIKELQEQGHEIGSHSMNHPRLTKITRKNIISELKSSKEELESRDLTINSLAIPYGDYNEEIKNIAREYYSSVRSSDWNYNFFNDIDKYNLKAMVIKNDTRLEEIKSWINNCEKKSWLILMYHLVREDKSKEYSTSPEELENVIKYIKSKKITIGTVSGVLSMIK
jgi:peptidoglycan/xylan/chitin deacetylase (PgdA/CDA1 family)